MIIAYLRVSTGKQTLANQQNEISRFTDSRNMRVDRWVTEIVSGKKSGRERKLGSLVRRMKKGDTLIVTELSRLSRTLTDIMSIVGELLKKKSVCIAPKIAIRSTIPSTAKCSVSLSDWSQKSSAISSPCGHAKHWRYDANKASYSDGEKGAIPNFNN